MKSCLETLTFPKQDHNWACILPALPWDGCATTCFCLAGWQICRLSLLLTGFLLSIYISRECIHSPGSQIECLPPLFCLVGWLFAAVPIWIPSVCHQLPGLVALLFYRGHPWVCPPGLPLSDYHHPEFQCLVLSSSGLRGPMFCPTGSLCSPLSNPKSSPPISMLAGAPSGKRMLPYRGLNDIPLAWSS